MSVRSFFIEVLSDGMVILSTVPRNVDLAVESWKALEKPLQIG